MWLYNFGLTLYVWLIRLVAPRHPKARLWIDGRKDLYKRMAETIDPTDRIVWVHVASLGEFEQGRPIIERIRKTHPEYKILLTFFSPSGYEVRKNYQGVDYIFYLPIDTPRNARRFLDAAHPEIAIFVKYEFWLNLLRDLRRRKVRTYIVSAIFRRNSIFFRPYGGMWRQALESFDVMFVQNEESKKLLAGLGFDNVIVAGDTRFDRVAEIAAAAGVMREFATPVPVAGKQHLVDIVGTGGDGAHTFNISSTAMFVAAAAGAKVAKHGGRSVSSSSGAADVMEQMGVSLGLSPEKVGQCIEETGMGFMFAPNHHSSMRHVAPVRKALGVKTVFNILGPLTNPAAAPNQVLGVFHVDLVGILSRVLQQLGAEHVLVVHGSDGLDEITLTGQSRVAELKNGEISEYNIHPEQFGIAVRENLDDIKVADAAQSLAMMNRVLAGEAGAARDIVLLNAAATIYAANVADSLEAGVEAAREAIDSGRARAKQQELVAASQRLAHA